MITNIERINAIRYFFHSLDVRDKLTGRGVLLKPAGYVPPAPLPEMQQPVRESVGERVSRSWSDARTRDARNTKDGVTVTVDGKTTVHKSTKAAFAHYELPLCQHVAFRADLKRRRARLFSHEGRHYEFRINSK